MRAEEKPLSENIGTYEAGDYLVTAAIWRVGVLHDQTDTYEIGIREKKTGDFRLLQNRYFTHQTVQEVANAIAHILSIPTECYTPEWICDWFGEKVT